MVRFTFLDVETSFRLCIVSSSSHTSLPTAGLSLSEKFCSYHQRSLVQTGLILTRSSLASYLGNNSFLSSLSSKLRAHKLLSSRSYFIQRIPGKKLVKNVLLTGRMYWLTESNSKPVLGSAGEVSTNGMTALSPRQYNSAHQRFAYFIWTPEEFIRNIPILTLEPGGRLQGTAFSVLSKLKREVCIKAVPWIH